MSVFSSFLPGSSTASRVTQLQPHRLYLYMETPSWAGEVQSFCLTESCFRSVMFGLNRRVCSKLLKHKFGINTVPKNFCILKLFSFFLIKIQYKAWIPSSEKESCSGPTGCVFFMLVHERKLLPRWNWTRLKVISPLKYWFMDSEHDLSVLYHLLRSYQFSSPRRRDKIIRALKRVVPDHQPLWLKFG